ncbi:MAG: carboxypeptidase regulatory-like domain-containing protein, partial [Opitutaceae bacterium]
MNPKIMNRKNPLAVASAWLVLALSSVTAISAADATPSVAAGHSGSVEGRVLNLTSGQYLNNARITVEGTSLETFTDSAGRFRLNGVPAGQPTVRVFYTGFPAQTATVVVAPGQTATQDFSFGASDQRSGEGKVAVLDTFLVTSTRETDARNIATNEQRFAANIKNVVAADAFGDASEGNIGEMMKHLPGVLIDYVGPDARSISVRGVGSEFTSVTSDGARMPSGSQVASRIFELEQVSINNVSRVEVTKVPTPSMPADSLGGSVNLVSRSAFESSRTQFKYRTYLNMNSSETRIFKKTPGPTNKSSYKVRPSFDFNYIAPFTKNFGIVINGLSSDQFTTGSDSKDSVWRFTGAGATPEAPYMRQYNMRGSPKDNYRASLSLQADWRPFKDHVLSFGAQGNYYHAFFDNINHGFIVGAAQPLNFGPTFTHGAAGGRVTHFRDTWNKYGRMAAANIVHRYTGRQWEIDSGINASKSRTYYRDTAEGHFNDVQVTLPGVSRILFDGIHDSIPGKITVLDAAGNSIDYIDLNNYRITNVVTGSPWHGLDQFKAGRLNVKRRLDFLPFEASLKVGGTVQEQNRELSGKHLRNFTFLGANGI